MPRSTVLAPMLAAALAALALTGARARAQECGEDLGFAPLEMTPSVGAGDVTIDAPIVVLYSPGYFGPEGPGEPPETQIRVGRCPSGSFCGIGCDLDDEATEIPGTVQVLGDRLFFLPDALLEPDSVYVGMAEGLDRGLAFRFCTKAETRGSSLFDGRPPTPPVFQEAQPDDADVSCALPEGGHRIGLRYTPATDDGPLGSVEYLLYLTRGHGVEAPELRDRVRNSSPDEVLLRLLLDRDEASEPVCVRVFAVDGVGNVSEPTDELCVDPLTLAAFQPLCSASAPGAGARPGLAGLALLATGLLVVRRRRR